MNDCSPDDSEAVIRELSKDDPKVIGISHSRNFGSQAAFMSGHTHLVEALEWYQRMAEQIDDAVIDLDNQRVLSTLLSQHAKGLRALAWKDKCEVCRHLNGSLMI